MKKKIAVGLSGGLDSSVAAYLLKKKGYDVVGFTLKFYPEENRCCDLDSLYQAQRLCYYLRIPHYTLDVKDLFKNEIIDYFIDNYLNGFTPNPCAYCNRLIKFGLFLEKIKSFGIDYLATGHYAKVLKRGNSFFLKKAKDSNKSQEYFLSLVKPSVLKHIIFPLADLTKEQVIKIAQTKKIMFKERKESQDVCFINDKSYYEFIEDNVPNYYKYKGDIKHINGKVLGQHKGIYHYTYGQRGRINIPWQEPLYVAGINAEDNSVVVCEKAQLKRKSFCVTFLNWFLDPKKYKNLSVKIRYNSKFYSCSLKLTDNAADVFLEEAIEAISPGQVAAFYYRDVLLGGGIIQKFSN